MATLIRTQILVAVAGGSVYYGTPGSMTLATNGASAVSSGRQVSITSDSKNAYLVDGNVSKKLDLKTKTVSTLAATSGKGTLPPKCSLACLWSDRLVLAGDVSTPWNWYMSRGGDHLDWDYAQDDALAAVAGNNTVAAGRVGDPILALMPIDDQNLVMGCDHTLFMMQGNPTNGGQIVCISRTLGVLGRDAWTVDSQGLLWVLSTGGLYQIQPGATSAQRVSGDSVRAMLMGINRSTHDVNMVYDRDRNGLWCFIYPLDGSAGTHLFYDINLDAWWPMQFPASHGPASAVVYDGDGSSDRMLLMGGTDGHLRMLSQSATTDDGTAIASNVMVGPVRPGGDADQAILSEYQVVAGAGTTNLTAAIVTASRPELLASGSQSGSVTLTTVGRKQVRDRARASTFGLKLSSSSGAWTFEEASGVFAPGGRLRS